jgi:hypothetical protein
MTRDIRKSSQVGKGQFNVTADSTVDPYSEGTCLQSLPNYRLCWLRPLAVLRRRSKRKPTEGLQWATTAFSKACLLKN